MIMNTPKRYNYVCANCGSEDLVFTANSYWNKFKQRWDGAEPFDDCFCHHCNNDVRARVVTVRNRKKKGNDR